MSAEGQTIPDDMAQRVARLINEAEDMRAQAVDDLKTIYGDLREELRALGWAGQNVSKEVAALKGAIAEMRLDDEKKAKREEKNDRVDDYVSILRKGRARAPARTRENIEQSGADLDPKLAHTIVTGLQTETGRAALVAAVDILIERDEAEEQVQPETATKSGVGPLPGTAGADGTHNPAEDERDVEAAGGAALVLTNSPIASASHGEAEVHSDQRETDREAAATGVGANEGGEDVESSATRAGLEGGPVNLEPSGPEAERATNSPETANVSLANGPCEAVSERTANQVDALASAAAGVSGQPETIPATSADRAGEAASAVLPTNSEACDGITWEACPFRPMKSLPYASCFPELSHAHYQHLSDSIANNGVREPIVRMGDVIVDGWSRYNICRTLGIEYPVVSYLGNDVLLDVIAWQREARQFTPTQERQIASRLAKEIPHRAADIMAAFSLEKEMA